MSTERGERHNTFSFSKSTLNKSLLTIYCLLVTKLKIFLSVQQNATKEAKHLKGPAFHVPGPLQSKRGSKRARTGGPLQENNCPITRQ